MFLGCQPTHPAPRSRQTSAWAGRCCLLCKDWTSLDLGADYSLILHWPELKLGCLMGNTPLTAAIPGSVLMSRLGTYLSSVWSLSPPILLSIPQHPTFSTWLCLTLSAIEELVPTRYLEVAGWLGRVVAHSREFRTQSYPGPWSLLWEQGTFFWTSLALEGPQRS